MKFNWKALVKTVAPVLGTALGGPLGGMAVRAITGAILPGKPDATEDDLEVALASATPEQLMQIRQLDQQFAKDMKALDIDVFKLETLDVQSARELYKVNYWPQIILSGLYVTGYFVILFSLMNGWITIPVEVRDTVTVLIGMLTTAIPIILGFWFGSSFGSREKTHALAASRPADQ